MEELFRAFFATNKLATDPNLRCGVGRGKKGGWAVHHGHVSLVQVPKRDFTFSRAVTCFLCNTQMFIYLETWFTLI